MTAIKPLSRRQVLLALPGLHMMPTHAHAGGLLEQWLDRPKPRLFVGLLDVSASAGAANTAAHVAALHGFWAQARPGDVLLGAVIGDAGIQDVQIHRLQLPRSGKRLRDNKTAKEMVAVMMDWLERQPQERPQSRYLEALAAIQAPIAATGLEAAVLIAGDGIESSALADFERPVNSKALIEKLRSRNLLLTPTAQPASAAPILRLAFANVGGASADVFIRARAWWEAYTQACGAHVTLAYYGRGAPPLSWTE